MSLRYLVAFLSFFLLSSLSLPAADLWDQPSKTDSHFFTDHQYVSSYTTESEREWERVNANMQLTYLSIFICVAVYHREKFALG